MMKLKVILCILCFSLIIFACGKKPPKPAKLSIWFSGDVPSSYDCNNQSRFQVSFKPYNQPDMTGDYLKMFFRLQIGDTTFYESNDIDFPISQLGDDTTTYTLELGGAIEGEYLRPGYWIYGYLAQVVNGDFGITAWTQGSYISVTPKTSFSKTMHIEYDCQESYGLTPGTFAKLTAAFHIADTDTDFLRDEINMNDQYVGPSDAELTNYHNAHYGHLAQGYSMHLLGVEGLVGNSDSTTGESRAGPYGWSFIFVQDISDFNPVDPLLALYKTTVHELGHQRAALTHASGRHNPHPEKHDSPFCTMNEGICWEGNNDNDPNNDPPGLRRFFDTNPHFCDMCVNVIRNITW
jgi:hypothetical protein